MSYLGNTPTTQAFTPQVDYFSGNASTTAFTLSRPVASSAQVEAVIENVVQNPSSAYTVSGNTITFTSAPPSGTSNIYVRYTSPVTQVIAPSQGTVNVNSLTATGTPSSTTYFRGDNTWATVDSLPTQSGNSGKYLTTNGTNPSWSTIASSQWTTSSSNIYYNTGNVGIGTASPSGPLDVYTGVNTDVYIRGGNAVRLFIGASSYDWKIASNYYITGGIQFVQGGTTRGMFYENGNFGFDSGYGSTAAAYGCRAWVLFDSSNASIRQSGNVSSVTYNGSGTGTVNMTNAMPDVNYAVITGTTDDSAWNNASNVQGPMSNRSTSSFVVTAWNRVGGGVGPSGFSVAVFR